MSVNYFRLSFEDRNRIEKYLSESTKPSHIAIKLGVNRSTISREISRNTDSQGNYRAVYAHKKSKSRTRQRKLGRRKILLNPDLKNYVNAKLKLAWSPDQIAKNLKTEYTTNTSMHVSHEAIYQYIYVLPRGGLKKTLIEGLRQSRKYRRIQKQQKQDEEMRGKIKEMLSIHERPKEVEDRIIPGHWESDLIIGKYKRSAVATLVERVTRYTLIVPLPKGKVSTPYFPQHSILFQKGCFLIQIWLLFKSIFRFCWFVNCSNVDWFFSFFISNSVPDVVFDSSSLPHIFF